MMHYDGGDQRAMSAAWILHINNDFDGAEFVSESYGAFHRQSWKVATDWFLGVHGIAMWNNYSPDNPAGQQFLDITGASDNAVYGVGLYATYDTRDNFFYPMQGTLFEASTFISYIEARQGLKISCIEEIAYNMNYISKQHLKSIVQDLPNGTYKDYLMSFIKIINS